jgi:chromate reductase
MTDTFHVAVLVGSLRKASFTRQFAMALPGVTPPSLALSVVELPLTLYNQDLEEAGAPADWVAFRTQVARADAVLFVTPEYNRSVPGALKNAIDVGSRPPKESVWPGKPGGVISLGLGALGGFGANHHLRQALVFVNVPVMQQPEAYIPNMATLFNDDGTFKDATRDFAAKFMTAFGEWVGVHAKKR